MARNEAQSGRIGMARNEVRPGPESLFGWPGLEPNLSRISLLPHLHGPELIHTSSLLERSQARRRLRREDLEAATREATRGDSNGDGYALRRLLAGNASPSSSLPSSLPGVRALADARVGGCVILEERREVAQEGVCGEAMGGGLLLLLRSSGYRRGRHGKVRWLAARRRRNPLPLTRFGWVFLALVLVVDLLSI
jgi:hypothetical protein